MKNLSIKDLPYIGMTITKLSDSPRIELNNYVFCGTWLKEKSIEKLIGITYQHTKTGKLISNELFQQIAFLPF